MQNNNECMCVYVCTLLENLTEEIGQDELEEDSIVESDREENIMMALWLKFLIDWLLQCPQTLNMPLTHRNKGVTFIQKTCGCQKWKG